MSAIQRSREGHVHPVVALITVVFLVAFGYSLSAAGQVRAHAATARVFAVVAYVAIELS
jgi:hypothetical protein